MDDNALHPRIHVLVQVAGRPLYRNAFTRGAADGGWLFNPFNLRLKNIANTGVIHWGGKLLALWEVRS
jgi:all-trans-8'-apo-beta-carotenal 15,15'-oxygenase